MEKRASHECDTLFPNEPYEITSLIRPTYQTPCRYRPKEIRMTELKKDARCSIVFLSLVTPTLS